MRIIQIFISFTLLLFACKSNKSAVKQENKVTPSEQKTTSETLDVDSYRFIVSFISMGGGPDIKVLKAFTDYVSEYNAKTGKTIVFERFGWGREGESDYCFKLSEITSTEQVEFIKGVNKLINGSKLVHVSENAKCNHKR